MTKIKILNDYLNPWDDGPAVEPGTIIEDALLVPVPIPEGGEDESTLDAWYFHPTTGEDWMSLAGDFEVIKED